MTMDMLVFCILVRYHCSYSHQSRLHACLSTGAELFFSLVVLVPPLLNRYLHCSWQALHAPLSNAIVVDRRSVAILL